MVSNYLKIGLVAGLALLAASASADRLIAVDSSRALYELDMLTGAKTQIGTVTSNAGTTGGLAYDRVNDIVYLTSTSLDSLFTLDLATGTATLIGHYGDSAVVMHGLEYDDSTGKLYGMSSHNTGTFYEINKFTGLATQIGPVTGTLSFQNLGYNSDTDVMYLTTGGRSGGITDALHIIDRTTGLVTDIGPLLGPTNPNGLAYNWNTGTMYLIDNSTDFLYTINLATGAATAVGSTGTGNLLGLAYIPEPATFAILGLGLALLAARRR